MQILSFLFEKHLEKTVLAVVMALSVFMLTRSEESQLNSARAVSSFLLYPVDKVEEYFNSLEELREENRELREIAVSLYQEQERMNQFRSERIRLRRLLEMREDSFFEFNACEVISRSSNRFHHSLTVDKGGAEGIRVGMAVVGYRGLAGRVTQVFPHSSRVMLLNNKSISVSCQDKRSRVIGILNWERGNLFRLDFIGREEDVLVGDTLLTSGLGRIFPQGFPVGTVFRVAEDRAELSLNVGVLSMMDLGILEELFIVTGGRDWDSDAVFEQLEAIMSKDSIRGM
ncbi:MAG: rod shape-determining protein MreC [Candidatus Krumholzibacteriota bacterium]|nr:rod shape-determining protein MreC [Candidatus Krumholzibacteriota bacterium]